MSNQTIKDLEEELFELRSNSMTLGERFSNKGQAKLDREIYLIEVLSKLFGLTGYDYLNQFENKHKVY